MLELCVEGVKPNQMTKSQTLYWRLQERTNYEEENHRNQGECAQKMSHSMDAYRMVLENDGLKSSDWT